MVRLPPRPLEHPKSPGSDRLDERRPARFYRALAAAQGLADRPWFRNRLWAPALEDGYGAETFPDLRRAARGTAGVETAVAELVADVEALRRAWAAYADSLAVRR